jgi:hypothetical protein
MSKLYRQTELTDEEMDTYTFPHVLAMTGEKLHSKAEIAEELGARDKKIKELEQAQPKWISVEGSPPKESGIYLACSTLRERQSPPKDWVDALYHFNAEAEKGECQWQHSSGFYDNGITHYMPQPPEVKR